jgi:hypothetical protein
MTFASAYLAKGALFNSFINERPLPNMGIAVVIPAYDEPEIELCLSSLASCSAPPVPVEVIIIVNSPASSGDAGLRANRVTLEIIEQWRRNSGEPFFRLFVFDAGQPGIRGWGVGAARKTGMDEAVRRFGMIEKPEGVIVSLDADCTVSENYFTALWNDFGLNGAAGGCSINFRHRSYDGPDADKINSAIRQYDLHLRYYVRALEFTGFPYPFHTVGSAMAVKAHRYVKAGGMPRRQGGEDFYFIQKLVVSDDYITLDSTTVYPSARLSGRVPFGTGPAISQMVEKGVEEYMTYNPEAFYHLKVLFSYFRYEALVIPDSIPEYCRLPEPVQSFISEEEWNHKIREFIQNTSSGEMFSKRFFTWFNGFKIVKFLNMTHSGHFNRVPVEKAFEAIEGMSYR